MSGTVRESIDSADANNLATLLRLLGLGSLLQGQLNQQRQKLNMTASPQFTANFPYSLATLDVVKLPDGAKASTLRKATARAGTAAAGILTVDAQAAAAPSTLHIGITPSGDIKALHTDAWTDLDVEYSPVRGDVVELVLPVSSNACVFPTSITNRGVIYMTECESLVGTLVAKLKVLMPADSPSTGQAALTDASKAGVTFASADAVTRARVKLLVVPAIDLNAVLDSASVSP